MVDCCALASVRPQLVRMKRLRGVRQVFGCVWNMRRNMRLLIVLTVTLILLFITMKAVILLQQPPNVVGDIQGFSREKHVKLPVGVADTDFYQHIVKNMKTENAVMPRSSFPSKQHVANRKKRKPCYDVHIFYYPWYGNPELNKHYLHWNHRYLQHWSPDIAKVYPRGAHKPPHDIAANYFPELGAYSSTDEKTIIDHMQQLSFAGVGVIAVSYYPPGQADENGEDWQAVFSMLLKAANKYKIRVTFHIEPYKGRSEVTVKNDIKYIIDTYSQYPAFYKFSYKNKLLPLLYVYDSYHTSPAAWATLLKGTGEESIRATKYDCFLIGLVVEEQHAMDMVIAGFDGFYTYFASIGFTYGSRREHWPGLKDFAVKHNLLYIPSIGPGYIDTRVRPWNNGNTRRRIGGKYYSESWRKALSVNPQIISITSFNEWHEGTQIEKAIPKSIQNYKYLDYRPHEPEYYLVMTKNFVSSFEKRKEKRRGIF